MTAEIIKFYEYRFDHSPSEDMIEARQHFQCYSLPRKFYVAPPFMAREAYRFLRIDLGIRRADDIVHYLNLISMEDLLRITEADLMKVRCIGRVTAEKVLAAIRDAVAAGRPERREFEEQDGVDRLYPGTPPLAARA